MAAIAEAPKKEVQINYLKPKQREINQLVDGEIWKIIPDFKKYEASTFGRIRNRKTKRLINRALLSSGYCVSSLRKDNKRKNIRFHRIIAQTFIPNPENKPTVNHKDKNRQNNHVDNLEWATQAEQNAHQLKNKIKKRGNFITNSTTDLSNIDANEIWKPVKGFEKYQISNYGRVKYPVKYILPDASGTYLRITYGGKTGDGYLCFGMSRSGGKTRAVHILVAEAFIPNPENKPCVNHKDGNRKNNRVDNLEWVTKSENTQHAYDIGLKKTEQVCQLDENNKIIKIFQNMAKACKELNLCKSTLCVVCNHKYSSRTTGGFWWVFEKDYNPDIKKLDNKYCRELHQIDKKNGNIINIFNGMNEAAIHISKLQNRILDNVRGNISNAISGRCKSVYGYKWKYKLDTK